MSRIQHLAVAMAIVNHPRADTRVRMILWYLAERWGTARADGMLIPKVTQEVLGELIATRRPTVSSTLRRMEHDGEISRAHDGWTLHDRLRSAHR
jgi:CRP-like cAMP-binding protein